MTASTKNEYLPLTPNQIPILTGQLLYPDQPLYNMAKLYRISGPIDTERFSQAFDRLVRMDESLRTTFTLVSGDLKQRVQQQIDYELEILDWSLTNSSDHLRTWAKARTKRLFDLRSCSFDCVLIKLGEQEFVWYWNQHHALTDAKSTQLTFDLMNELYVNGEVALKNQPGSYSQFLQKWSSRDAGSDVSANKQEDLHQLYGEPLGSGKIASVRRVMPLSKDLSEKIKNWCKSGQFINQAVAVQNFFLTVTFAFLRKVAEQETLSMGLPTHCRTSPMARRTPGLFMQLFPVTAIIDDHISFDALSKIVQEQLLELWKGARPDAQLPVKQPQVVVNFLNTTYNSFASYPTEAEWVHADYMDPNHALRIQIVDYSGTGNYELYFDCNEGLLGDVRIESILAHYKVLLESVIDDEALPISRHLLTTPGQGLIQGEKIPAPTNILERLEEVLTQYSDRVAITNGEEVLTYRELEARISVVTNILLAKNITKGSRVVILLDRSTEFVISVLSVLKVGATFIPIATDNPKARIVKILEECEPHLIISQKQWSTLPLKPNNWETHWIEEDRYEPIPESKLPWAAVAPEETAYIMFTSGSSGTPKGVQISQEAIANYLFWAKRYYDISPSNSFALCTSVGFDLTITTLLLPFLAGASLTIFPQEEETDMAWLKAINDPSINTIKLTPAHLGLAVNTNEYFPHVRTLIIGGEELTLELAKTLLNSCHEKADIFNEYGPTEVTVGCIVHKLSARDIERGKIPIGSPINNVTAVVVDESDQALPAGISGELWLAGRSVALGYWHNPKETETHFVHHDGFGEPDRYYKTGDVVRRGHDGQLLYEGRRDEQIKVNGIRIELGEIEAAIISHPEVTQASVNALNKKEQFRSEEEVRHCENCGLPSNYPGIDFNDHDICSLCTSFNVYQERVKHYFRSFSDLRPLLKSDAPRKYDCIMLLSGGKDSTYALAKLVDLGLNVLTYTLDNGYISEQAKDNIRRVTRFLQVDHLFDQTEAMNEIFVDSLKKFDNVCNGCFKTIYTLSTKLALEKDIPYIVTGLSRGQFFETRLTEELFWSKDFDVDKIDETILDARKSYHRTPDAISENLDTSFFEQDDTFQRVQYIDFYRYCDVDFSEIMNYLDSRLPWVRPTDTGRSTNCLINQLGIYTHKKRQGYSNYAFPYSWDVRMGHKTRKEALDEINEEIDEKEVLKMMEEIGFDDLKAEQMIVAHYVAARTLDPTSLRAYLQAIIPRTWHPQVFIRLEEMPLTNNGKIDRARLRKTANIEEELIKRHYEAPENDLETLVQEIWESVLQIPQIGVTERFLELGGQSLSAIRIMTRINDQIGTNFPVNEIFQHETIRLISSRILSFMASQLSAEDRA